MTKGKYAVRAANKRAFASHQSADELRTDLDAANKQIERLNNELAHAQSEMNASVERQVREALREERARMKAAMRDNTNAAQNKISVADRKRAERDAAIVVKLETALRGLLAEAVKLTGEEAIFNMQEVIEISSVFEDLGVKHGTEKLRSILGFKSRGQVVNVDGQKVYVNARYLNRRSTNRLKQDRDQIEQERHPIKRLGASTISPVNE